MPILFATSCAILGLPPDSPQPKHPLGSEGQVRLDGAGPTATQPAFTVSAPFPSRAARRAGGRAEPPCRVRTSFAG
jgi:hypothetical protein